MSDAGIVITGMGVVSALGTGCEDHLEALRTGRDGLRRIERFDTTCFTSHLGGTWPGWDARAQAESRPEEDVAKDFPVVEMALVAAREAWQRARLTLAFEQGVYNARRTALVFGTCFGHGFRKFHQPAERLAAALGVRGACITISTSCSSSTNAIGLARDLLRRGDVDAVIAGGADVLLREAFAGFSLLGVLSAEKCAPFSEPAGTTLGEGAGFLVLERAPRAAARGLPLFAALHGYGLSSDGFHETAPDPTGAGIARAIRGALLDAGWPGDSVDYVSAHATGTANNDHCEWSAIKSALGLRDLSVSGSKSQLGHASGASGVLELILALLAMCQGEVPPTRHFRGPRAGCPRDPVAGQRARPLRVTRALKLSAAFGGANAALAFGPLPSGEAPTPSKARARVVLRGIGVVGPGAAISEGIDAVRGKRLRGPASALDLRRRAPSVDPRRLDASSRFLVAACSACLAEAGRAAPRGAARGRAGLFVGATRMPEESAARCRESMRQHGVSRPSASAFARMAVNSPAGACSRLLGLLGPTSTISIGEGSGLLAIALAADWLATREDADCIVAGSVDELAPKDEESSEGSVCVLLERGQTPAANDIVVAGWGFSGPDDPRGAARQALWGQREVDGVFSDGEAAALIGETSPLGWIDVSLWCARAEATRSALAFIAAAAALRRRTARSVLVVTSRSRSMSCAVLLTHPETESR